MILVFPLFWAATPGRAQQEAVVVELYTSQGCASCPPADAFLAQLAGMEGVIALALHVDYWDYIGWKDQFAQPEFTQRQQAYAVAAGERSIYTPQIIIGGVEAVVGVNTVDVMMRLQAQAALPARAFVDLARSGDQLVIEATTTAPGLIDVYLVRFKPEETVDIEQGENAGHTIRYVNIVTSWELLDHWAGDGPLRLEVAYEGADHGVVILQEQGPGAILAAALID